MLPPHPGLLGYGRLHFPTEDERWHPELHILHRSLTFFTLDFTGKSLKARGILQPPRSGCSFMLGAVLQPWGVSARWNDDTGKVTISAVDFGPGLMHLSLKS